MAKKTLKLVDPTDPASAISPPRPLGKHGMGLWQAVLREYDIADIGGREMLAQLVPRLTVLRSCASRSISMAPWSD